MKEYNMINYSKLQIPYTLIQSRRKSCAISVDMEKGVIVRIPVGFSKKQLGEFFQEKEEWITRHYLKYKETQEKINRKRETMTPHQREALQKRYREAAKEYIPKRVEFYKQFVTGDYSRITIRDQKTRWGSCSASGTLSFSWRLMLAPPTILDYVVVHELCHFEHMNHSREFWQAVENILPDYKQRRDWLKEHGAELMLF